MSDKWLTVSQAALQLGISERQARRYAGRLAAEDREDAPDTEPDATSQENTQDLTTRPARRPARVRLEAMQKARDEATKRENPTKVADTEPDAPRNEAGLEPDIIAGAPDTKAGQVTLVASETPPDWQERATEYKEQIQFLRGMVEQHQRSEAELRAALREALRAQPRQLTSGDAPDETPAAAPQVAAPVATPVVLPTAQAKAPTPTRQVQKQRAVRELLRAFFGIGDSKQ